MDESQKLIAICFDDGPNTSTMVEVLDVLEENGAVATFFIIGSNIKDDNVYVMERALEMGCELGNHSWSHSKLNELTDDEIEEEIEKTQKKIYDETGFMPKLFCAPHFAIRPGMYEIIDLPFISGFGSVDYDKTVTAEQRVENFFKAYGDNKIMSLHCFVGNDNTVEALKTILPRLVEEGYKFVTVSELFELRGAELKANSGEIYAGIEDRKTKNHTTPW